MSALERSLSSTMEPLSASDKKRGSKILKGLLTMYRDGRYSDISLKIGHKRILRAHRAVLASFSPYFEALLGANWEEGSKDEIEILGLDENAVSDLIEFAYSGNINITKDNVQTLVEAANYLGVDFVKKSCGNFLKGGIDDKTCLGIWQLADFFALEELSKDAKQHALRHFADVCKDEEFVGLPFNLLCDLLADDKLFVVIEGLIPCVEEREKVVLQAVFKYIEHDEVNRKDHLPKLLSLVRLPTLSEEYLKEVTKHKFVVGSCEEILEKAKKLQVDPRTFSEERTINFQTLPSAAPLPPAPRTPKVPNLSHVHTCVRVATALDPPVVDSPDEKWAVPRDVGLRHFVSWGRTFANGGKVKPEIANYSDTVEDLEDLKVNHYITGMELWIRQWYGTSVLGGLKVYYQYDSPLIFGYQNGGIYTETAQDHHKHYEFHLEKNEKIVKVEVNSGWMIDKLTFYTNKKDADGNPKRYGPYGGDGGSTVSVTAPGSFGFLAGVAGTYVRSQDEAGITRLQFAWRCYIAHGVPPPRRPPRYNVPPRPRYNDEYADNDVYDLDISDDCRGLFRHLDYCMAAPRVFSDIDEFYLHKG